MPLTLPTLGQLEQFLSWLFGDALSWANIVQVPALFLTGGAAWVLCHPVRARITAWADRHPDRHHLDWLVQHRPLATRRLVPLITPAVWAIGLWISVSVAEYGGWPHAVAQVAVNLLMAWLVIRLAAEMVPNQVLARLIAVLSWSVAALNITHLLEPTLQLLDNAAIVTGGLRVSLLTVTKGVLSLTILLWAASLASKLFERRITRVSQITPRARVLLGKLLKTTLVSVAVLLSLVSIGIDLSTFALFTGALGVGIGLGLQRTVSNLFSGVLGARYVAVETRDGTEFLIPNEDIITHQVINWSHNDERVRLKVPVRVPHDSDLDQVIALMREAASRPDRILTSPAPNVLILSFGESAIELEVRFWIADAQHGVHNVKSEVLYEVWRLFRREGIQIPYPKRDLYVRSTETN
jgi:small-conductance mechanosensitive channel